MTDEHELVARLNACDVSEEVALDAASTITRLLGERDDAIKARTTAIRLMTEASREAGEWKGKFQASELCGIVEGWQRRALTAEARVERLERALKRGYPGMTARAARAPAAISLVVWLGVAAAGRYIAYI